MKNNFTDKTKELFFWNQKCWWCGLNHSNCLHHALGRVSNSPLNAIPLNNFSCHIGNGTLSQFEVRKQLLKKTYDYLMEQNYKLTKEDREFIKKFKQYYEKI
jgi:hypothetical protein